MIKISLNPAKLAKGRVCSAGFRLLLAAVVLELAATYWAAAAETSVKVVAVPGVAFKISALGDGRKRYESHLRRFLTHASLECIQWINVGRKVVAFKTIKR